MEFIKPGVINIFIGDNGSGKSTILDIIHSVVNTRSIASLPRENPLSQTTPAINIEFSNGNSLYTEFDDVNTNGIAYVNVIIKWRIPQNDILYILTNLNRYESRKPGEEEKLLKSFAVDFGETNVIYKPQNTNEFEINQNLIDELILIHPLLKGVYKKHVDYILEDLPDVGPSFYLEDKRKISVRFSNDYRVTNKLSFDWLPSGWKSYLNTVLWLLESQENSVCIIEEPELHINPKFQRVLMKRIIEIVEEKKLQIFMSTHSASFIDYEYEHKLMLFQTDGNSVHEIKKVTKSLLNQLGYKASDILHPNCIIWVEGPSDQIYLEHWIKKQIPSLIKNVHYSIISYGGALSRYMSLNPNTKLNTNLLTMNPNSFVIIDSDKTSEFDNQQDDARRFNMFENVWITEGREIENYIDKSHLKKCIKLCYPKFNTSKLKYGKWKNLLKVINTKGKYHSLSKTKIARAYAQNIIPNLSIYDLENRVNQVCQYIIKSNKY